MIKFRANTSFPFLKFARESGVPYGEVLRRVPFQLASQWWHPYVDDVAKEEEYRRKEVRVTDSS